MNDMTIWEIKDGNDKIIQELSAQLKISPLMAALLQQRGICAVEEAAYFLNAGLDDLQDPYHLKDMGNAVRRIGQAVAAGEKIVVYGDYDVDGVCSIVMLIRCLERLGGKAGYYVPDRFEEGYGLNLKAVEKIADEGCRLLITVDCGITSLPETERARALGMDVIITDHHNLGAELPSAVAVINPKRGTVSELEDLCGAAVVFKLCQALCPDYVLAPESCWLELVALATVADIVALRGENRILVKYGLRRMSQTGNIGLQALLMESGLQGVNLLSWHIGFMLGPRLNSAGRLKSADLSVELLLTDDTARAAELAGLLGGLNNERKLIEEGVFQEALRQIENLDRAEEMVLVLDGEEWHQGVIGIVASRLCERYRRPTILISWENGRGRGSCRSLPGLNIYQALSACSAHLIQFGGHRAAAGLSIARDELENFRQAIAGWVKQNISLEQFYPRRLADAELEAEDINQDLLKELERLEPFGEGNPSPRFVVRGVEMEAASLMGKQKEHFRARLGQVGLSVIAFNRSDLIEYPLDTCLQDIYFQPEENDYKGVKRLQLRLTDMKNSYRPDDERMLSVYGKGLLQGINAGIQEIYAGNPVLFVFPTVRSLLKIRLLIYSIIRASVVKELHGSINRLERHRLIEELKEGKNRIFLMTAAFLDYYRSNYDLPKDLKYILSFAAQPAALPIPLDDSGLMPELPPPARVRCITASRELAAERRVVIYANRRSTMQSLAAASDKLKVEAQVNNLRQRAAMRRKFKQTGGILVSDGAYSSLQTIDSSELYFADAPYSIYEARAVLDQMAAASELEAKIWFGPADLDFNRSYLQRSYPGVELLRDVLGFFKTTKSNPVVATAEELSANLAAYLQRAFKPADLNPVLIIMEDLGLCEFKKKGSILAINFIKSAKSMLNPRNSPYYLEGRLEKEAYKQWENELNNMLLW